MSFRPRNSERETGLPSSREGSFNSGTGSPGRNGEAVAKAATSVAAHNRVGVFMVDSEYLDDSPAAMKSARLSTP
jgi:hypothetical protein